MAGPEECSKAEADLALNALASPPDAADAETETGAEPDADAESSGVRA